MEPQDDIHWYWFRSADREFVYERVEERIFRDVARPHSHTRFNVASLEVDTFPPDPMARISVTFHGVKIRVLVSNSGSLSPTFGWLGSTSRTCFLKREALFCLLRVRGGMIEDGAVLRLFMATMQTAVIE